MNHTSWADYGRLGQLETDEDEVIRVLLTAWLHQMPITPADFGCEDEEPALVIVGAVRRMHCWRFALTRVEMLPAHEEIVTFLG